MRLWHYRLIPYLPNSQLKAQWREIKAIINHHPHHILINYVYAYEWSHLVDYSRLVIDEMTKRGFQIRTKDAIDKYENAHINIPLLWSRDGDLFPHHHTDRYLLQCFYNLQEKYDRGQRDFSEEQYNKLEVFMKKYVENFYA